MYHIVLFFLGSSASPCDYELNPTPTEVSPKNDMEAMNLLVLKKDCNTSTYVIK